MYYNYGFFPFHFGGVGMIFFIILAIVLCMLMMNFFQKQNSQSSNGDSAKDIAKERFARGEITEEEFDKIMKKLK